MPLSLPDSPSLAGARGGRRVRRRCARRDGAESPMTRREQSTPLPRTTDTVVLAAKPESRFLPICMQRLTIYGDRRGAAFDWICFVFRVYAAAGDRGRGDGDRCPCGTDAAGE